MASSITQHDLTQAVEHVAFEVVYFRLLSDEAFVKTIPNHGIGQAVGYAQLIHFRVLLEFFYPGRAYDDDCTVQNFIRLFPDFDNAFPAGFRVEPAWRNRIKKSLDKMMAHMAAHRWRKVPRPDWSHYRGPMKELGQVIDAFQNALPASLRSIFEQRLKHWEQWSFTPVR
jgi:hypothetical protein